VKKNIHIGDKIIIRAGLPSKYYSKMGYDVTFNKDIEGIVTEIDEEYVFANIGFKKPAKYELSDIDVYKKS